MSGNTYKLDVLCENCDYCDEIEIPKGQKVDVFDCPKCGVAALKRDHNAFLRKNPPHTQSYV